jgi:hypothetical protein
MKHAALLLGVLGVLASIPATADEEDGWPREIETAKGLVVVYQPQIDSLEGDILKGRGAVAVIPPDTNEPIFGAAWLEARIETDLDTRMVKMEGIRVPRVRFPDATPEQEQGLIDLLTREIPTWNVEMSQDRMLAALDLAEAQSQVAEGFENAAPKILFADKPTVLVSIDGEPRLVDVDDTDLQAVVNTPFTIVLDPKSKVYYLYAGNDAWYAAPMVEGPWETVKKVPKKIRKIQPEDEPVDEQDVEETPSSPPAILVATEPTELIVTDGPPELEPIAGGELLVYTNTEDDVLVEIDSQLTYVLLSGRWFASKSLDGPWEYVRSDQLPDTFADIDPDSDQGYLLTWVAGTEMADEAVLDAAIPQTAAIKRNATITVTYDGHPRFEGIEGTSLRYAVNTESQVIQAGEEYYCAYEGAWYVASSPNGAWRVATEIPDEIRSIPPSSPVYNTKYVYIYDSTPEVVYVGYYPGYTNSYVYHGVPVYGTGWYYRPWYGSYYYPRHSTWGFHVRYNPWYGWSFGFSYSTGRFTFSLGYGGWYRGGWWGPVGYRGYHRGYHRGWHHGYRAGAHAGYRAGYRTAQRNNARNIYHRQGNDGRLASPQQARAGAVGAAGAAGVAATRTPGVSSTRANNVYTDKSGNVHRQQPDGSWQTREGGQWKQSDMAAATGSRAGTADRQRPTTSAAPTQLPSSPPSGTTRQQPTASTGGYGGSSLNNDAYARQRGTQRTQSYQRSGASRGGGGRSKGGGRRR